MNRFFAAFGAAFLAGSLALTAGTALPGVAAGAKTYTLNNAVGKNAIVFLSEAPVEKINGTADGVTGSFVLNAANVEATTGTIEVAVKTMKTANSKRDEHMYSAMWLDEASFPKIVFTVTSLRDVKVSSANGRVSVSAMAVGTFSMHGETKELVTPITLQYVVESDETKKRAPGPLVMISTTFDVALKDYKVKGKDGVVGKSVGEVIKVQASLFANS
jgi:polyisoprenoid-binding protein YceI